MTLRQMLRDYPRLFRQDQSWHRAERFMDAEPRRRVQAVRVREGEVKPCFSAVELAQAFLLSPDDFRWRRWLWTTDLDHLGQRVFVGVEDGRFEIHRHLALTPRFGTPTWT